MTIRMLHLRVVAGTGGGPEKTILNSPRFIRRHGFEAHVVYLCPPHDSVANSLQERALDADCPLTVLPDRGPFDWRILRSLLKICREKKIQLLQTHDYKSNALGLILRRFHRCSMVSMLHGWTDMSGRMPLYKKVDQWCLPRYQSLICVSADLVEECKRLLIPDSKIHLVHNGIDVDQFQRSLSTEQAKKEIGARDRRFLIGSVGRLSPEKGFVELIRAVHSLQAESIPLDLWIAGDGPQRTELEKLIVDLGLQDSVKLLGQLKDTITFYQAMDLFVLNSIREGLPNVLLEAMALGTPVVATAIAGIPSLVLDGICGRLIAPQNDAELRNAIRDAIHENDKTAQMARAARMRIEEEFSFAVRMEKIARIYENVIHGRKGKREL